MCRARPATKVPTYAYRVRATGGQWAVRLPIARSGWKAGNAWKIQNRCTSRNAQIVARLSER
jgi:hypothetical protein